jgi:hypothetical protein
MKRIKFRIIIPTFLLLTLVVVACSKSFLDKPPQGVLSPAVMATENGVQGLLIGAYSLVDGEGAAGDGFASGASNWTYGGVAADDAYKGSDPTDVSVVAPFENWVSVNATNGAIPQKWTLCYAALQRCNDVINTMRLATDILPADTMAIKAQVLFLRSYYHMELLKVFGNIIYVDENINTQNIDVSNTSATTMQDVWTKVVADLQFAVDNLPPSWGGDKGRANSWAAKALLAKAYMFQQKYSDAYPLLKDIIANGVTAAGEKYALNPHFFSNFNPAQKNSSESIFAAQTSVQDGSSVDWGGDPNGNYGDILNFPYTGGPGACCGFYNPSQDLADAFKTDANGLPLLDTWFQGLHVSDQYGPVYTGTLDPRIDWTMGRPGIPYLDWGLHPGVAWIRNPVNDGNKSPIKNVYAASQKGYTDVGSAYWAPTELTANNVNIIRLADVILWAAECAADAGDLSAAMGYVNQVRTRAADPSGWVYKYPGSSSAPDVTSYDAPTATFKDKTTPADNYKIGVYQSFPSKDYALKAIKFERRLELAMEGHRFFDLVRWGDAAAVINAYMARESSFRPLKQGGNFVAPKNNYFPIPQGEIDNMNSDGIVRLQQNPGY